MSVEQLELVDAIGTDRDTGAVVMTVMDHLPWDGDHHLTMLKKKLANYVRFVESGQIFEGRPEARGAKIIISVIAKCRPSTAASQFLEEASRIGTLYADNNLLSGPLPPRNALWDFRTLRLCPNPFDLSPAPYDDQWAVATSQVPWWGPPDAGCDLVFSSGFDGP